MCGDGVVHTGEACDIGTVGQPDPLQIIQGIGSGTANAEGTQLTAVAATASGVTGNGEVRLQCGYSHDLDQCPNPNSVPAGTGVDRQGCCRARPTIAARIPEPAATGVCRNARITVQFDQLMDSGSIGAVTDLATSTSFTKGAALERCTVAGCRSDVPGDWEAIPATPSLADAIVTVGGQTRTVSELSFALTSALIPSTVYRVRVLDTSDDTPAQQLSIRSSDGVRLGDASGNAWIFTTGTQVCTVSRIEVVPPSYLLQRRESRATLRAQAIAQTPAGDAAIVPIVGTYAWNYAWSSNATDIATTDPLVPQYTCGSGSQCAFKPAEPTKNGDAFGIATAGITANAFGAACTDANAATACGAGRSCAGGHCVGESFTGRSQLRALICENPWPSVVSPATWDPYPAPSDTSAAAVLLRSERLSLAYCRDQGDRKVCRPSTTPLTSEAIDAKTCAQDSDCANVPGTKCLLALRDDLPAFDGNIVEKPYTTTQNGVDELRKEFLFLPREAAGTAVYYCSVSGERCDSMIAGMCPAGEFCRAGNDAVGLRIYENEEHVAASRWFAKQKFTEGTTPIEVDGYRGVQSGRTTYLNAANVGSVFTNMIVLSTNDGAVAETRAILNQMLQGIRLNTDLVQQNTRMCLLSGTTAAGRCGGTGQLCLVGSGSSCPTGTTCALATCTADRECQFIAPFYYECGSPKDKLTRDVKRMEDLNDIRLAIEAYGHAQARCSVTAQSCDPSAAAGASGSCPAGETCFTSGPTLAAGTFIPGITTSRWPSWQAEFGGTIGASQLPVDPLNVFGGACSSSATINAQYDQQTCWNQQDQRFAVPPGSYFYRYQRQPNGQWSVSASFEYVGTTPSGGGPVRDWVPAPAATIVREPTNLSRVYNISGRCGDGVLQSGETCDPPGSTNTQACTPTGGAAGSGSQANTCQQDCTLSAWSACGRKCGNFVVDTGEACDVGPIGGNVPVGHPTSGTVPGMTTGTQYECSTACAWSGGYCGDNVAQSSHGEQCDGTANVAVTAATSSTTTQYACTAVTDTNPCKATGGYCGDSIIHDGKRETGTLFDCNGTATKPCATGHGPPHGEQCDGNETRSCIDGNGDLRTPSDHTPGTTLAVGGQLPWQADPSTSDTIANVALRIPFTVRTQNSVTGTIRLTLETSNAGSDLTNLTRDQIEPSLPSGTTMNDYNPRGAQGGVGLYHRIKVQSRLTSETSWVEHGSLWALASTAHQTNSIIMNDVSSGDRILRLEWNNDWIGDGTLNSNLVIHRVSIEGAQTRSCGSGGASSACEVLNAVGAVADARASGAGVGALGWGSCEAAGANCGDGVIDDGLRANQTNVFDCDGTSAKTCATGHGPNHGEQCDDSGKGRCSNNLVQVCTKDADCGAGNRCDQNADLCTSTCQKNGCGDGATLAPTCASGTPAKIGQPCTTNADCGASGICRTEQCDLGIGNWRATCASASDPRCVPNAVCEYGRTCNYCTTACSVATKQGGFCGDGAVNGSEVCEPRRTDIWTDAVCTPSCSAICPPSYVGQAAKFGTSGDETNVVLASEGEAIVRFPGCRLLGNLAVDVAMNDSVGRMNVVIITDRTGSMGSETDTNSKLSQAKRAIADDGGLIDRLFAGRGAGRVRVSLVSYGGRYVCSSNRTQACTTNAECGRGNRCVIDSDHYATSDQALSDSSARDALKTTVRGYTKLYGTRVADALTIARGILPAGASAGANVVILLSDGATDDAFL